MQTGNLYVSMYETLVVQVVKTLQEKRRVITILKRLNTDAASEWLRDTLACATVE